MLAPELICSFVLIDGKISKIRSSPLDGDMRISGLSLKQLSATFSVS